MNPLLVILGWLWAHPPVIGTASSVLLFLCAWDFQRKAARR